jgi:hypothetical protein
MLPFVLKAADRHPPLCAKIVLHAWEPKVEGPMSTAKDEFKRLIDQQPEDSTAEEIIRELAFHAMIERGLADADTDRVVPHLDVKDRIRSWQK